MGVHHNTRIAEIAWLIEPEKELHGQGIPLRPGQHRVREFLFTASDRSETTITFGTPSRFAAQSDFLLRARAAPLAGNTLDLSSVAEWRKHPEQLPYSVETLRRQRDFVLSSWGAGISYRSDKNGDGGLRTPQAGALHAIEAHWSVNQMPGIIVMPTGTGKTEVMVAVTVASQCRTVLVVVPSDALRSQTARKFQTLGVLRSIGTVPSDFLFPLVGTLRRIPQDDVDLEVF